MDIRDECQKSSDHRRYSIGNVKKVEDLGSHNIMKE